MQVLNSFINIGRVISRTICRMPFRILLSPGTLSAGIFLTACSTSHSLITGNSISWGYSTSRILPKSIDRGFRKKTLQKILALSFGVLQDIFILFSSTSSIGIMPWSYACPLVYAYLASHYSLIMPDLVISSTLFLCPYCRSLATICPF